MQRIQISNFGPVKSADIELKKITVLIGEQASGKSHIGKLITFFKTLPRELFAYIYNNEEVSAVTIQQIIHVRFIKFFGSVKERSIFLIKYYYSEQDYICFELQNDKTLRIKWNNVFLNNTLQAAQEIKISLNAIKSKKAFNIASIEDELINEQIRKFLVLFNETQNSLYIPAGRSLISSFSEQFKFDFSNRLAGEMNQRSFYKENPDTVAGHRQSVGLHVMIDFLRRIETIKDRFKEFGGSFQNMNSQSAVLNFFVKKAESLLKGNYRIDNSGEKLIFNVKNNQFVYLDNASSGQQESIRMIQDIFLLLYDEERAFRAIEEPEAHLFPMAQKDMIELLVLLMNIEGNQLFINTHSPYILSAFNNLLFAKSIADKFGEKAVEEIKQSEAIAPEFCWIDKNNFSAYSLKGSEDCEDIFNKETGMISESYLDEISLQTATEYETLFKIFKKHYK